MFSSIKGKLIALGLVALSYLFVAVYGVHIGDKNCSTKALTAVIKEEERGDEISKEVNRMLSPDVNAAIEYWLRD